ncbi:uncharacterized protein LOC134267644 [Saccostrea cucullata]|uniref:uncharacterized protein LOC134267644 n=1 Tax=Saccostrea cuccullata TaxID=36930 RepID=UPI002ED2D09E
MDISGIQNLNNEITTKLLELIFYGRIPSNVSLEEVAENISKLGVWLTEKKYPKTPECKKIDRIIFIASAAKPGLPLELMQAVLKVLRRKGDIPVFGVLTKKDLCQEEEEELKQIEMNFKTTLGLSKLNYLNCTNYCDENIDEIQQRIKTHYPELDKPVHKFLIQVLDPVVQSIDFHTSPGSSKERVIELVYKMVATLKGIDNMHMLFMIAVILLIAIILALVFMRP